MSATAPPETTHADRAASDPSASGRRRVFPAPGSWRAAFREFVVIVAGVLAALAAQAWWTSHEDRARERDYLAQLLADTRENERRLATAIDEDETAWKGTTQVLTVLDGAGPPPPPDSLVRWMGRAGRASDFQPVTGTYRALLGTGDLRLIRTDSLRTLLTAYTASLDSEGARLEQLRGMVLNSVGPLARAMPFMRGIFSGDIDPNRVDVEQLRRNPDAAVALFTIQAANANRLAGLRRLQEKTVHLRRALEAEPVPRASE